MQLTPTQAQFERLRIPESTRPKAGSGWQHLIPYELLAPIFHFATEVAPTGIPFGLPTRLLLHDPLAISHVCRLWRDVALSEPPVWKYVDCSIAEELLCLVLERSRNAPIHVCADTLGWRDDRSARVVEILSINIWRMVTLQIHVDNITLFSFWHALVSLDTLASALEYLAVVGDSSTNSIRPWEFSSAPQHIFGDNAPALRRLYLHGVDIPFASAAVSNPHLTHLALGLARSKKIADDSVVYNVIQAAKNLQHLSLHVPLTGTSVSQPAHVHPPHLEMLHIACRSVGAGRQCYARFFRTVATDARVALTLESDGRATDLSWDAVAHVPAFARTRALAVDGGFPDRKVLVRGYDDPASVHPLALHSSAGRSMVQIISNTGDAYVDHVPPGGGGRLPGGLWPGSYGALLTRLFNPRNLLALTLTHCALGDAGVSSASLALLKDLTELHVLALDAEAHTVFRALTLDPMSKKACCPALKKLTVNTQLDYAWADLDLYEAAECLKSRVVGHIPLAELAIDCPPGLLKAYERRILENVPVLTLSPSLLAEAGQAVS